MMNHADNLERSYDDLTKLVAGLVAGQLDAPTPCAGWDVRSVLNHVLGAGRMFTLVNAGQAVGPDAGDVVGDDPAAAIASVAAENVASWRRAGARDGDRTYPFGTFPAPAALLLNLTEVVVHSWDLAKATDQDATIDPQLAADLFAFWEPIPLDAHRASGAWGPPVAGPTSASMADRLLGHLGRQP